jgi:cytochrome c oxidase cbb3-type subunit 3
MFSNILSTIEGVTAYPMISLAIFVPFFLGVVFYVVRMKSDYIEKMSHLPLDNQQD